MAPYVCQPSKQAFFKVPAKSHSRRIGYLNSLCLPIYKAGNAFTDTCYGRIIHMKLSFRKFLWLSQAKMGQSIIKLKSWQDASRLHDLHHTSDYSKNKTGPGCGRKGSCPRWDLRGSPPTMCSKAPPWPSCAYKPHPQHVNDLQCRERRTWPP